MEKLFHLLLQKLFHFISFIAKQNRCYKTGPNKSILELSFFRNFNFELGTLQNIHMQLQCHTSLSPKYSFPLTILNFLFLQNFTATLFSSRVPSFFCLRKSSLCYFFQNLIITVTNWMDVVPHRKNISEMQYKYKQDKVSKHNITQ